MKIYKILLGGIFLLIGFFAVFNSYIYTVQYNLKDLIIIVPLFVIGFTLVYQRNNNDYFKWNKTYILIISLLLFIIITWIDLKTKQSLCVGRACGLNTIGFPLPVIPSVADSDAQGTFFVLIPLIGLMANWIFYYIITRSVWKIFAVKKN